MYDRVKEKKSLYPSYKWYENEYFQINSSHIERHPREDKSYPKRYDKNNAPNKLKRFHLFVTSLHHARTEKVSEWY